MINRVEILYLLFWLDMFCEQLLNSRLIQINDGSVFTVFLLQMTGIIIVLVIIVFFLFVWMGITMQEGTVSRIS